MSVTAIPDRVANRWHLRLHYVGAFCIGIVGFAHLLVFHSPFTGPLPAAEQAIADLAAATPSPMFENGRQVTVRDFNTGCSAEMGMLSTMFMVLSIVAARRAPHLVGRWSSFSFACLVTSAATVSMAIKYFPEPVIIFAALATLSFALVCVLPTQIVRRNHS